MNRPRKLARELEARRPSADNMSDLERGNPAPSHGTARVPMTDEQALALARLMRGRMNSNVNIIREPFDLPAGYILVTFVVGGFTCGIAPDGSVSS